MCLEEHLIYTSERAQEPGEDSETQESMQWGATCLGDLPLRADLAEATQMPCAWPSTESGCYQKPEFQSELPRKLGGQTAMPADDSSLCSYFFFLMLQLICELFSVITEAGHHKEPRTGYEDSWKRWVSHACSAMRRESMHTITIAGSFAAVEELQCVHQLVLSVQKSALSSWDVTWATKAISHLTVTTAATSSRQLIFLSYLTHNVPYMIILTWNK